MKNLKFEKGKVYKFSYKKRIPTRAWRGTNIPSEFEERTITGEYEYIGNRGNKLHFYDGEAGIDALMGKQEAINALV